jgi:hypothetical protein
MSDSLNATLIVIWLVSTISAKPELLELLDDEEALLEPPRLPAVLAPVIPVPVPLALEPEEPLVPLDPLVLPELPDETESPGETLSSEAIVPLAGA